LKSVRHGPDGAPEITGTKSPDEGKVSVTGELTVAAFVINQVMKLQYAPDS
jgi:hypothetical protein